MVAVIGIRDRQIRPAWAGPLGLRRQAGQVLRDRRAIVRTADRNRSKL